MSGFQNSQGGSGGGKFRSFEIKEPAGADHRASVRQVESETGTGYDIREYQLPDFRQMRGAGYQETRAKYGPLAVTDPDHHARSQKDARFRLNSLQREPLAVDEEEKRVIDELVQERVRETEVQIRETARDQGYQEGFEHGRAEAEAQVRAEGAALLERLSQFVPTCEGAKEQIARAQEKLIVEMILRMGRAVLLRELATDKEHVLRLASEMIASTDLREHLRLKISAQDIEDADRISTELTKTFPELRNLRIEASPLVQQGGAILESQWSTTDAAVETQIQRIFAAVLTGDERK